MAVPGADDVMLNYQTSSFHDVRTTQQLMQLKPAPEFEMWLQQQHLDGPISATHPLLQYLK